MPNTRGGKTADPELGKICKEFNENKTKKRFSELCDMNPNYDNRQKCRICGEDIFYNNVVMKGPFQEYPTINNGTSFLSTKKIGDSIYKLTVCEDCMKKEFEEYSELKNKGRIFNMPNKYSKFAFQIPDDEFENKKKELCVRSEESFISKYGEEEGRKRWNEYVEKERYTKSFEYMCEKHGMTIEDYDNFNKSRACTLDNMVARYGEEDGLKRWNEYVERQRYTTSKEYFLKTYGEIEGLLKWKKFEESRMNLGPYSNVSQELFNNLKGNINFKDHNIRYATHGGEVQILTSSGNLYYLDYYDENLKVCVEFNGIKFHPSPKTYNRDDIFVNPYGVENKVGDLWDKEELRKTELFEEFGIRTIVIWEDDYRKSKLKCLTELIDKILSI